MKKIVTLCLFITIALLGNTQKKLTNCGYIIPPKSLLRNNFASIYEAKVVVKEMTDSLKWQENFQLQEKNGINNAYATVIRNQRWIVYDNDFLESLDQYAATKWASVSVMAHEMGHHYYNHVLNNQGSTIPTEIEADYFSGYMMQKLGATLQQALAAMQTIATDQASSTHPAKKDRLTSITKGWNAAKASTTVSNIVVMAMQEMVVEAIMAMEIQAVAIVVQMPITIQVGLDLLYKVAKLKLYI